MSMDYDLNEIVKLIDRVHEDNDKNKILQDFGKRGFLNAEHPFVEIEHDDQIICIDLLIYPFIKLIWTKGIETIACCQGDDKCKGYVSFPSLENIIKFCDEFTYFKEYGEFDILNINLSHQGHGQLVELTYDIIAEHTPVYGDLYSVRFEPEILGMF